MFVTERSTNEDADNFEYSDTLFHYWPYQNQQPHYLTQPIDAIDRDVRRRMFKSVEPGYLEGSRLQPLTPMESLGDSYVTLII
jgi:hypothetical protein